jgi:hypothetical protein
LFLLSPDHVAIDLDQSGNGSGPPNTQNYETQREGPELTDKANALSRQCAVAAAGGADFPTVWNTILRLHPLVISRPKQTLHNGQARLEISLITGQRLIFDSSSGGYSVG